MIPPYISYKHHVCYSTFSKLALYLIMLDFNMILIEIGIQICY